MTNSSACCRSLLQTSWRRKPAHYEGLSPTIMKNKFLPSIVVVVVVVVVRPKYLNTGCRKA